VSLNDLFLCLVSALGIQDYIGRIYFYPMTHMIFLRGSVTPGSVMTSRLIMSARPKIDTELCKFILNTSKRAVFLSRISLF